MSHHAEWIGDDDDLTLTVPLASAVNWHGARESDTDIVLHPDFAADLVTEELPIHSWVELSLPAAEPPVFTQPACFPSAYPTPFTPTPVRPRSHSEMSLPSPRARLDSESGQNTWKRTVPALRKMVGLPIMPGWASTPTPEAPPPIPNQASTAHSSWSPLLLIAMAVGFVAIVVMSIVGFGSRAAEATRAAHTRIVSATGTGGAVVNGRVFVDGRAECEATPCELELTTGGHWITVRAPGYQTPPSRSINAGADEPTDVTFDLTPSGEAQPKLVAAEARPKAPPAAVSVAAALPATVARAPVPSIPTPDPPHRAAPSKRAFVAPAFAATARLNVNAIPAASVVLDGRPVGHTPLMGFKVKPGSHSVVLIGPGGKRAVRGTVVAAGATATVAARL
jgi:hypothetical protein